MRHLFGWADVMAILYQRDKVYCIDSSKSTRETPRRDIAAAEKPSLDAGARAIRLPQRPAHHVHQFRDLAPLISFVVARYRIRDAMGDMLAQNTLLNPAQRGARRGDLGHDVNAITVVRYHAGEPANLAFDPVQSFKRCRLAVLGHKVYIPP